MEAQKIPFERGCRAVVELVEAGGEREQRTFTLVTAERADAQSGLLGENTPLARAIGGKFAGQVVPYRQGGLREIRILSVERVEEPISGEAADKRRAEVKKAEAQSEITNQMIFASASGSKWGDYEVDMEKLLEEKKEEKQQGKEPNTKKHKGK